MVFACKIKFGMMKTKEEKEYEQKGKYSKLHYIYIMMHSLLRVIVQTCFPIQSVFKNKKHIELPMLFNAIYCQFK